MLMQSVKDKSTSDMLSWIDFWFISSNVVHDEHYQELFSHFFQEAFGQEEHWQKEFCTDMRIFLLSKSRSRVSLTKEILKKFSRENDINTSHPSSWPEIEENIANIILMPEHLIRQQVCMPIGCLIMSDRVRFSLYGEDVRQWEKAIGERLFSILRSFASTIGNPDRIAHESLAHIKSHNFLDEAENFGLSYFLAACQTLDWPVTWRVMLKMPGDPQYNFGTKNIHFLPKDKKRVWSFIWRAFQEVGQTCFDF